MSTIAQEAIGRWPSILTALGVSENFLRNKHQPCPVCGGRDRFRFDNKHGKGTYYCGGCGAGDGWTLLQKVHGWDFATAAKEVERIIGVCPVSEIKTEEKDVEKIKDGIRKIWKEAQFQNVVNDYIKSRGLSVSSNALKGHQWLPYKHEDGTYTKEKAVVALVKDKEGKVTTLRRIFLMSDGSRKKLSYGVIPDTWLGGAVRLYPFDKEKAGFLAIAEGIETALAVRQMYEMKGLDAPVWAACTAGGLEAWQPPEGVERVSIFGDSDPSFVGQKATYALAERLARNGIQTEVHIPKHGDWLDFLVAMQRKEAA